MSNEPDMDVEARAEAAEEVVSSDDSRFLESLGGRVRELRERRLMRRFLERLPRHRMEEVIFRLMRDFGAEEALRRKRVALIGLRGAGKSTLGSMLAKELKIPLVELN